MTEDALAGLKPLDRERWLAALWAPAPLRPALAATLAFDLELERVVADAREPLLAEIRLAWWREQLARIASGEPPPAQPLLRVLAKEALPLGVDLVALSRLEDSLLPLLSAGPVDLAAVATARGASLAAAMMAVEGPCDPASAAAAGARIALARFARRRWGGLQPAIDAGLGRLLAGPAQPFESPAGPLPRVLSALDSLARADLERWRRAQPLAPPASPSRQLAIARAALGLSFRRRG